MRCGRNGAQCVHLLAALGFGHDYHRLVAQRVGDQRETDPGVARGPFDYRSAGQQRTLGLGIANDPQRRAVFDRCAGVGELTFAPDLATRCFAWSFEQDQRGVANEIERVGAGNRCSHTAKGKFASVQVQRNCAWTDETQSSGAIVTFRPSTASLISSWHDSREFSVR